MDAMDPAQNTIHARVSGTLGAFQLDVEFSAPARGITAIYGPTGSGKSTLLRWIAGLTPLQKGFLQIGNDVWQDKSHVRCAHRRELGFVFQDARLFPHLTVRQNLTFAHGISSRPLWPLDDMVAMLGLQNLLPRLPQGLSGGERQRVAIGRALLSNPRLLLMDEPLSAMDSDSRQAILRFLENLKTNTDLPVLFVTHAMDEVERLADTLVLMREGRVLQSGPLTALQQNTDLRLAHRRRASVVFSARHEPGAHDVPPGYTHVTAPGARFVVPHLAPMPCHLRVRIQARDVSLWRDTPPASSSLNHAPAVILATTPSLGGDVPEHLVTLGLGTNGTGTRILARVSDVAWRQLDLAQSMAAQTPVIVQFHALDVFSTPVGQGAQV